MSRKWQEALAFAIFAAAAVIGFYRIRFGFDLTDEGLYLATPMRYALGDRVLHDEIMNGFRLFDVLMMPIFKLFPNITLLQVRSLGLMLDLGSMFALYLVLRAYAPPVLVALACTAGAFLSPVYIWTPGYNLLSSSLLLIGVCAWLGACRLKRQRHAIIFASIGGVLACLSCIAYGPNALTFAVPVVVLAIIVWKKQLSSAHGISTGCFLAAWCVTGLMFAALITFCGLYDDWKFALGIQTATQGHGIGLRTKFSNVMGELRPFLPHIGLVSALLLVIGLVLVRWIPRNKISAVLSAGLAGSLVYCIVAFAKPFTDRGLVFHVPYCILAVTLALIAAHSALSFFASRLHPEPNYTDEWVFPRRALLSAFLLYSFVQALFSSNVLCNALEGIGPVFATSVVAMDRLAKRFDKQADSSAQIWHTSASLCAVCFVYGVLNLQSNFRDVYRDAAPDRLTSTFQHPLLKGIRSNPERTRVMDELLRYLDGKVHPGDFFLAYDHCPGLYYLTHTRPAVDQAWLGKYYPPPVRQRSVDKMIASHRVPTFAIRCRIHPERIGVSNDNALLPYAESPEDPVNYFVVTNYERIAEIAPFEIWKLKDSYNIK